MGQAKYCILAGVAVKANLKFCVEDNSSNQSKSQKTLPTFYGKYKKPYAEVWTKII